MPKGKKIIPQAKLVDEDWELIEAYGAEHRRNAKVDACVKAARLLHETEMVHANTLFYVNGKGRFTITNSDFNNCMRLAGLPYRLYFLEDGKSMWDRSYGITKVSS